jgi:hypothetical protein
MPVEAPEREARLLPVVTSIFACAVCILVGSYLIGNYIF